MLSIPVKSLAILALLVAFSLATVDSSLLADDPGTEYDKEDSAVSPLLLQFIERRETSMQPQTLQENSDAATRSQASDNGAKTKEEQSASDPSKSGAPGDRVRFDSSGNIQVYIHLKNTSDDTLQQLRNLGVAIEIVNSDWKILQAWVPVSSLDRIADLQAVRKITPPDYPKTNAGSVVTEGDSIHRANLVRHFSGITGEGVRVGVISNGVDDWHTARATRDLPSNLKFDPQRHGRGHEGTAMLEIVHDLAPGAELAFSGPPSSLGMIESILWLANDAFGGEGADIIVDDLSFWSEPYFKDGPVAQAAADAVEGGVVYVTSPGNSAEEHYEADFVNRGDGFHAFDGDSDISMRVTGGGHVSAYLQWNDTFGASRNDYDVYICMAGLKPTKFNLQNDLCDAGARVQDRDDDPEEVAVLLDSREADVYIRKYSGDGKRLEMIVGGGTIIEYGVPEGGIISQGAVEGVLAAGAISAFDPGHDDQESFSDRGPSRIYDSNGNYVDRPKPDVMGIDRVSVTGSGGFPSPFPGTSAAAPHIAAIAALLMEAQRKATPNATKKEIAEAVTQRIRDTAVDLGDPGQTTPLATAGRMYLQPSSPSPHHPTHSTSTQRTRSRANLSWTPQATALIVTPATAPAMTAMATAPCAPPSSRPTLGSAPLSSSTFPAAAPGPFSLHRPCRPSPNPCPSTAIASPAPAPAACSSSWTAPTRDRMLTA